LHSDGRFDAAVPLAEGTTEISVLARDAAGLTTERTVRVTRDVTPPELALDPLPEETTREELAVSGHAGADAVSVELAGHACRVIGGRFSATVKLAGGDNEIRATARD